MRRETMPCPSDVLDEATSALDVEGESVVLERLQQSTPRPTIVSRQNGFGTRRPECSCSTRRYRAEA
jgi:hypothetical protein